MGRSRTPQVQNDTRPEISTSKFSVLSLDVEEGEFQQQIVDAVAEEDNMEDMEEVNDILESDLLEDEMLDKKVKENDKSGGKKGGRGTQKAKAQPKSKRSSRRKL